jgi:hypothetical protein
MPAATEETQPYWSAAAAGQLVLPFDARQDSWVWPPAGANLEWKPVSGEGQVATFSIVHRAPSATNQHPEPYVIAFVALDEGVRLFTRIVGAPAAGIAIGQRVRVLFEVVDEGGPLLPVFTPIAGGSAA